MKRIMYYSLVMRDDGQVASVAPMLSDTREKALAIAKSTAEQFNRNARKYTYKGIARMGRFLVKS